MLPLALQIIEDIESHVGEGNRAQQWSELARQYPWYTTAWLGSYAHQQQPEEAWHKIALQVTQPLQLQLIAQPMQASHLPWVVPATADRKHEEKVANSTAALPEAEEAHVPQVIIKEKVPETWASEEQIEPMQPAQDAALVAATPAILEKEAGEVAPNNVVALAEAIAEETPLTEGVVRHDGHPDAYLEEASEASITAEVDQQPAATENNTTTTVADAAESTATEDFEAEPTNTESETTGDTATIQQQEAAADSSTIPKVVNVPGGSIPGDTDFIFQPYHTVDYFASLGIKIDPQTLPTTRFDNQLKSFTQWLKTMKRIEQTAANSPADPAVEAQAAQSVVTGEILTETMAEVLVKQGKTEHALDIYAKLTLLHPEKTAFFAAQIEKLKATK